ncbi:putative LOC100569746 [Trichonephila clavipes]|nr:putative LOC100569746 [Trichonephila clavipes]
MAFGSAEFKLERSLRRLPLTKTAAAAISIDILADYDAVINPLGLSETYSDLYQGSHLQTSQCRPDSAFHRTDPALKATSIALHPAASLCFTEVYKHYPFCDNVNYEERSEINGDRYTALITNFFIPELNNHDVQELWFQQDGATCHTARATIDLLKDALGDRLISRFGPVNWPPRSCDLTTLDYFLWRYVKSLVYADKPQTLDHLEDNIRRVIADIRTQMLEKVIDN